MRTSASIADTSPTSVYRTPGLFSGLARSCGSFAMSRWRGLFCALLVGLCIFATNPRLEMGTNDDWSYVRTSLDLVRTGHVIYNGWAAAMLGWQVFWGALAIKLFGFSFFVLRLSALPFAMGSAYLLHQIFVRFGLNAQNAILGTLTIVLSPVFLPLAASFMTDVPGFFWLLVCLYSCLHALAAKSARAAILWLAFATLSSVAGGTGRQIIWLGTLVMVPSAAWLLRKRRGVLSSAVLLWLSGTLAIVACMYWFQHQPYSIPEKLIAGEFTAGLVPHVAQQLRDLFQSVLLLALPALVAYLAAVATLPRKLLLSLLGISLLLLMVRVYSRGVLALAPWLPNLVTEYGVGGSGEWESLGQKPLLLLPPVRFILTVVMLSAACAFISAVLSRSRGFQSWRPEHQILSWRVILALLTPFTFAYLILLLPRATFDVLLDRYTIPLLAIFVLVLLLFYQQRVKERPPAFSFLALAVFSAYSVATTHDYFATNRARLAAASRVQAAGIPRTEIEGGWEYDGWTQIDATGYVNDFRLEIPVGAYHKFEPVHALPESCRFWFSKYSPAIKPRYFVVFSPKACLAKSGFAPVTYRTWLPPSDRRIYIQRWPNALSVSR